MKNTQSLSAQYNVRKLDESDVNEVLELTKKNPLFFNIANRWRQGKAF